MVVMVNKCCLISMTYQLHTTPPTPPHTHTYKASRTLYSAGGDVCSPFLPALWCKDDLRAPGSRESPYTQVWHYSVRKACWESSGPRRRRLRGDKTRADSQTDLFVLTCRRKFQLIQVNGIKSALRQRLYIRLYNCTKIGHKTTMRGLRMKWDNSKDLVTGGVEWLPIHWATPLSAELLCFCLPSLISLWQQSYSLHLSW